MRDTKLRIGGQLVINLVSFFCFYFYSVLQFGIDWKKLVLYTVLTTFLVWELLRLAIIAARKRFPGIRFRAQRLTVVISITLLVVILIPLFKFYFGNLLNLYGGPQAFKNFSYLMVMGQNIFYCLFITAVYEGIYFFEQSRKLGIEKEALKRENLVTQLHSLRAQVHPHFLFNNLNSLAVLIDIDNEKAQEYLEKMASMYRYLLQTNEQPLISLQEELQFTDAYYHLLQTRFDEAFIVQINIASRFQQYLIPPLTLQLLIENAVKHNVINADHPLKVSITSTEEAGLIVRNNLQKKEVRDSPKTSLININAKYRLLGTQIKVHEAADFFEVFIPLINPEKALLA